MTKPTSNVITWRYISFVIINILIIAFLTACAAPPPRWEASHFPPNVDDSNDIEFKYSLDVSHNDIFTGDSAESGFSAGIIRYFYLQSQNLSREELDLCEHDCFDIKVIVKYVMSPSISIAVSLSEHTEEISIKEDSQLGYHTAEDSLTAIYNEHFNLGILAGKAILELVANTPDFMAVVQKLSNERKEEEARLLAEHTRLTSPDVSNAVTLKYYNDIIAKNPSNPLNTSVIAYKKAYQEGYRATKLPTFQNTLIVIDNSNLHVPITLSTEIPLKAQPAERDVINAYFNDSNEKLLVIQTMAPNVRREILKQSKIDSSYVSEYVEKENPEYIIAYRNYQAALTYYNQAKFQAQLEETFSPKANSALGGLGRSLSSLGTTLPAANRLDQAKQVLAQTPQTIQVPIRQDYTYNEMEVKVTKNLKYYLYVLDPNTKKVRYKSFPKTESRTFILQYNKHEKDSTSKRTEDIESDVTNYESGIVKLSLTTNEIIEGLLNTPYSEFETTSYNASLGFLQTPAKRKTKQKQPLVATNGKLSKLLNSVVAIQDNGGKTIGTGFFVSTDLVLSNKHVVGDRHIVSVTTKDSKQLVGTVINTHYDLDLALLRVNGSGIPAELYNGPAITEGKDVIAIGNPMGLEYSVTKGIVSSIRKQKDNIKPFSSERVYIQTDVSINPGNSGGPLFADGKVIGINTMKLVRKDVEGIGFAIHYNEIADYLRENNVSISRSKTKSAAKSSKSKKENSLSNKLQTLKALYEDGLIDDSEYALKKAQLLEQL
ncbi:trypsin-like peptidase domain-containing protein [Desulfosediminicola flagellatus]|uniref:trypsin-like peptidase domain-containing protein n=1 Tax=Desulfosediminicola flagellatus TaxID=2569541 RepID=UPI0010ADA43D|nr:trypsin-like peptidase domain-containing protein [Desulfosediminicola flagellatus]